MSDICRPPNGYAISLYDELVRAVRALPAEIERDRQTIRQHQRWLAEHEQALANAESTLAWMRLHQADEIAALEADREKVRAALRASGEATP